MTYPTARRVQAAQIAALVRWSREDPHDNAVRGQAGLAAKFEREVPAEITDPAKRARAAQRARRAHMKQLAQASARARAARKAAKAAGDTG